MGGCVWGGHALTVLQEVPCMLHGFLHIVQLCMGGRRVTASVCLSVCLSVRPHAAHLVLARNTTTAPGCEPHDPGRGRGRGRGRRRGRGGGGVGRGEDVGRRRGAGAEVGEGVVQVSDMETFLPTVYTLVFRSTFRLPTISYEVSTQYLFGVHLECISLKLHHMHARTHTHTHTPCELSW